MSTDNGEPAIDGLNTGKCSVEVTVELQTKHENKNEAEATGEAF